MIRVAILCWLRALPLSDNRIPPNPLLYNNVHHHNAYNCHIVGSPIMDNPTCTKWLLLYILWWMNAMSFTIHYHNISIVLGQSPCSWYSHGISSWEWQTLRCRRCLWVHDALCSWQMFGCAYCTETQLGQIWADAPGNPKIPLSKKTKIKNAIINIINRFISIQ